MALTMIVIIPMGPVASKTLSAHPMDMDRNCFVTCSPKRVRSGANAEPIVVIKSDKSSGFVVAVGEGVEVVVVIGGAIVWTSMTWKLIKKERK